MYANSDLSSLGGNIIPVLQERLNVQANVVKIQSPKLKTQELSNKVKIKICSVASSRHLFPSNM